MEQYIAKAKENLDLARAQYEVAKSLYEDALRLREPSESATTHRENTSERSPGAVVLTEDTLTWSGINPRTDQTLDTSVRPVCELCQSSLLVSFLTGGKWPSARPIIGEWTHAVYHAHECRQCEFLAHAARLLTSVRSSSSPSSTGLVPGLPTRARIRLVKSSRRWGWAQIAGVSVNSKMGFSAWLELIDEPRTGPDSGAFVCLSFEPNFPSHENVDADARKVHGPRVRHAQESRQGLVDYGLVTSWVHICESQHGTECLGQHALDNAPPSPQTLYLIDVRTREVDAAQQGTRYIAMSYVWGEVDSQASATTSLPAASGPGKHACRQILPEVLPRTLEDALTLARNIQVDYVWIDKYCIDQSDEAELKAQVAHMDSVYRNAWLTVIALDGESSHAGLPGISRPFQSRMQPLLAVPGGRLVATYIENTPQSSGNSPWDQRAWTFQEFVLSRRCLIFSPHHVSMKCQEELFHELLPLQESNSRVPTRLGDGTWWDSVYDVNLNVETWDFQAFDGLLSIFTARQLRYPEDILRACQGSLRHITKRTGMAFTFGLPVGDLHRALLWKPHNEAVVRRRSWLRSPTTCPSWSWSGWLGRIEYDYWVGDMSTYVENSSDSTGRVINSRTNRNSTRAPPLRLGKCQINALPVADDEGILSMNLSSTAALCRVECVRRHGSKYRATQNGVRRPSEAIGDHWTLLEPIAQTRLPDIAGSDERFAKRDYFFRTDRETSAALEGAGCLVELLLISHWPLIRDSQQSNRWLQDMVSCLVILRNSDRNAWRVASVLLEKETWLQLDVNLTEVDLV